MRWHLQQTEAGRLKMERPQQLLHREYGGVSSENWPWRFTANDIYSYKVPTREGRGVLDMACVT